MRIYELRIINADKPVLWTEGSIYTVAAPTRLVINDVLPRGSYPATFPLAPGSYRYVFKIRGGRGKFTLRLQTTDGKEIKTEVFSTDDGRLHRLFEFGVSE